jgi:hypothetical protein
MAEKKAEQAKVDEILGVPALGAAGESSDPLVHQVLAERETAISNGDEAAVQALTERLAGLGVK